MLPSRSEAERQSLQLSKLRADKARAELRLWFVEFMLASDWLWPVAEYVARLVDERDLADYELKKLLKESGK